MSSLIEAPIQFFTGLDGTALEGGKIYIGVSGLDAEANPQQVYFDAAGATPATQPILTTAGLPASGGSVRQIFTDPTFSMTVRDENDVLVYSVLNVGVNSEENFNSLYGTIFLNDVSALLADTNITYSAGSASSVAAGDIIRTRAEGFSYQVASSGASDQHLTTAGGVKLYVMPAGGVFNVKAFGALGDDVTDDTAALQTAGRAASGKLIFPAGTYVVTTTIVVNEFCTVEGDGPGGSQSVIRLANGANLTGPILTNAAWFDNLTAAGGPVTIRNLFIDGNKDNNTGNAPGIALMTYQSRVESCAIFECTGHGIHWTDQNRSGVNVTGGQAENKAYQNRINRCDGSGIFTDDNAGSLTDGQFRGNIVGSCGGYGILGRAGSKIQGNHVYDVGLDGIADQDGFDSFIQGNSIQDWGQDAATGTRRGIVIYGQSADRPSHVSGNSLRLSTLTAGSTYRAFAATFASGVTTADGLVFFASNSARLNGNEYSFELTGSGTGKVRALGNSFTGLRADHVVINANEFEHQGNDFDYLARTITNSATPPVQFGNNYETAAGGTTFTDFLNGFDGQEIFLVFKHNGCTVDFTASNLVGNQGVDWTPAINDHMRCRLNGSTWYCEISDNTA